MRSPRSRVISTAATPLPRTPTPTLKTLFAVRLSVVTWVASTPADQTTIAWYGSSTHSRNIRMLESNPTSMPPPSLLSRTIGNLAMTTISGTVSHQYHSTAGPAMTWDPALTNSITPATSTPRSNHRLRDADRAANHFAMSPPDHAMTDLYQYRGISGCGWIYFPLALGIGFSASARGWTLPVARRRAGTAGPRGSPRATRGARHTPARSCVARECAAGGCSTTATTSPRQCNPSRSRSEACGNGSPGAGTGLDRARTEPDDHGGSRPAPHDEPTRRRRPRKRSLRVLHEEHGVANGLRETVPLDFERVWTSGAQRAGCRGSSGPSSARTPESGSKQSGPPVSGAAPALAMTTAM